MKTVLILSLMLITTFAFSDVNTETQESSTIIKTNVGASNNVKKENLKKERKAMTEEEKAKYRKKILEKIKAKQGKDTSTLQQNHIQKKSVIKKEKIKKKSTIIVKNKNYKFKPTPKEPHEKLPKWLKEDGLLKNNFMIWGGLGKHLYGYTDRRYSGDDNGAYLKSNTFDIGMEYYSTNFDNYIPALKDIRAGFNISFKNREGFTPKKLEGMLDIKTKTVPDNEKSTNAESWLNLGFFMGVDNKWYGFDLGLTISLNPYYEKIREFENGTTEKGRGWMWGTDSTLYPNLQMRLGKENSAHFTFNVLRGDYDLKYGVINVFLSLPIDKYFALDIGGSLYQADSIYIAPKIIFGKFSAKIKLGTIINYQDPNFTKVAIFDSLYGNLAISYEW